MAATGSDSGARRRALSALPRRVSLRLRLTLLFGACFVLGSGAVLAVTYGLVAHDTRSQTRRLYVGSSKIQLPSSPLTLKTSGSSVAATSGGKGETMMIERIHISPNGKETITWAPSPSSARSAAGDTSTNRVPQQPVSAIQKENLQYAACMRADRVSDYPDPGANKFGGTLKVNADGVTVDGQALSEPWSVVEAANDKCQRYIDPEFGPRYSDAQLAKIQTGALAMSACMRAHGLAYANLTVARGPGGHGIEVGLPPAEQPSIPKQDRTPGYLGSRKFRAANITCSRLLNREIPRTGTTTKQSASSAQREIDVIVERANGALTTQRSRSLRVLLIWSGVALGVMAVISILLGWLVAGRGLRPLRAMTSRARRITEQSLHERLSADTQEDELGELANTFDGVLARLERAFEAQKRFVANASHELRTPVTLERVLLETALAHPDADAEQLRHACERVLASNEQQQRMIEALLALARSQGGTDVDAPVNLADLAQDAITLRAQRLRDITVATDLHQAPLNGDPALLERLVANLIDNAIIHNLADDDAWITVETGDQEGHSWLRVSNSGREIPESMISEIFEPFRRMDGERTATATGLGLGLSIVQAIADVHEATVDARPLDGGGLRVEVRF